MFVICSLHGIMGRAMIMRNPGSENIHGVSMLGFIDHTGPVSQDLLRFDEPRHSGWLADGHSSVLEVGVPLSCGNDDFDVVDDFAGREVPSIASISSANRALANLSCCSSYCQLDSRLVSISSKTFIAEGWARGVGCDEGSASLI